MGQCGSSQSHKGAKSCRGQGKGGGIAEGSFRRPSAIMVMDLEGGFKELKQPVTARSVIADNPNCFLCNSESIYLGTCLPPVPEEEQLRPGRIYFLVPLSQAHQPLSLSALCDLAIKAASALP
ncbi:uncharacterized protein LOC129284467 [Prosopis cineraria]|uniref:uncharacterized protein LOC129284467 n=1 Tax=Prosopis cineraria TaxID=364024 RepID=UPI0024104C5F|nr:uncharacterized protein LOC129284467 [Prosopis cineraria]